MARFSLSNIKEELGINSLAAATRDTYLILLTRTLRMFAYGSSTLVLALYFAALGHSDAKIGLFMSLTLVGDVLISLLLTFVADDLGRRRIILFGSLSMVFSGVVFATFSNYWILLFAAVVGVISPSGNEIGPFRAVEESTIAHLCAEAMRSDIFAWYVVVGTLGTSGGALASGWMIEALKNKGWAEVAAFRAVFWVYALVGVLKSAVTLLLSRKCEKDAEPSHSAADLDDADDDEEADAFIPAPSLNPRTKPLPPPPPKAKWAFSRISPTSQKTLLRLSLLFSLDSLASGMVPTSLVSYYLSLKFSLPPSTLGAIISSASFLSSLGNICASALSKRLGFIHTMVFTHLPSAVFLMLLPAPHSLALTIAFLVARATLASMDQAPRSAFLSAVVLPDERTAVMGVINTLKTTAQSAGPLVTGVLAGGGRFWIAFTVAGAMKAVYDLGLLAGFSKGRVGRTGDDQRERARVGMGVVVAAVDSDEEVVHGRGEGVEMGAVGRRG